MPPNFVMAEVERLRGRVAQLEETQKANMQRITELESLYYAARSVINELKAGIEKLTRQIESLGHTPVWGGAERRKPGSDEMP